MRGRSLVRPFARVALAAMLAAALAGVVACTARDTCPRFAAWQSGVCGCVDGVALAGACVAPKTADAFCGPGARWVAGACAFRACPDAEPLDVASGECVPPRALRAIAAASRVALAPGDRLACDDGRPPIVDGEQVVCLPEEALCLRGTRAASAASAACAPLPRCAPGEIALGAACAPLLGRRGSALVVDVATWARAVLGPDGGAGTRDLCAPLALRPLTLGVAPQASADVAVRVSLRFPGNDVADVRATASVPGAPDAASALADAALRPLARALQSLGGIASTGAIDVTVRCTVAAERRPHAAAASVPAAVGP